MELTIDQIVDDVRRGAIPAEIYNDGAVFDLERERLFSSAWMFLAHTSEIPDPGDYVVRWLVHDSFIVVRDEEGQVQVLFNMCLHRGMQICRAELGNASHFRCPYHGWSYSNDGSLVGVPFHKDAYGGTDGLDLDEKSLLRPSQMAIYDGLIFVTLDPEAPSLDGYLGGMRYFLDFYLGQSREGPEVRGPQRWRVKANWKIGAENFAGDTYHTPYTHHSISDIGLFAEHKPHKRKEGVLYFADIGGGTTYKLPDGGFAERMRHVGYPDDMIERMGETWSPEQRALVEDTGFMVSAATVLPNLSFVHNWPQVDDEGTIAPFVSIRLWQPVGPDETEIYSWFAVDRHAPEWFKEASYKAYVLSFGSSGMFEQDDVENWVSITQVARGTMARRLHLHGTMGLDEDGELLHDPYPDWPAPGRAFQGFGEYNQRSLLDLWGRYVCGGGVEAVGDGPREVAP